MRKFIVILLGVAIPLMLYAEGVTVNAGRNAAYHYWEVQGNSNMPPRRSFRFKLEAQKPIMLDIWKTNVMGAYPGDSTLNSYEAASAVWWTGHVARADSKLTKVAKTDPTAEAYIRYLLEVIRVNGLTNSSGRVVTTNTARRAVQRKFETRPQKKLERNRR